MRDVFLWAIGVELTVAVLLGGWFIAAYWSFGSPASRHLMAVAAVMAGESLALLLALLRVPVPIWVFAAGYAVADVVVAHRLVLLHRARHERPGD